MNMVIQNSKKKKRRIETLTQSLKPKGTPDKLLNQKIWENIIWMN